VGGQVGGGPDVKGGKALRSCATAPLLSKGRSPKASPATAQQQGPARAPSARSRCASWCWQRPCPPPSPGPRRPWGPAAWASWAAASWACPWACRRRRPRLAGARRRRGTRRRRRAPAERGGPGGRTAAATRARPCGRPALLCQVASRASAPALSPASAARAPAACRPAAARPPAASRRARPSPRSSTAAARHMAPRAPSGGSPAAPAAGSLRCGAQGSGGGGAGPWRHTRSHTRRHMRLGIGSGVRHRAPASAGRALARRRPCSGPRRANAQWGAVPTPPRCWGSAGRAQGAGGGEQKLPPPPPRQPLQGLPAPDRRPTALFARTAAHGVRVLGSGCWGARLGRGSG
jgi:hypothetical protein